MTLENAVQHTITTSLTLEGKGVHSNQPVKMTLHPAKANSGIVFVRSQGTEQVEIPARYEAVGATELCTIIGDPKGLFVATIEHLMAALRALCVDNVLIEINGAEVPVMDGSSSVFVNALNKVGLIAQTARRKFIRVDKAVRFDNGNSYGEFTPYNGCYFDVEIDFDNAHIGRQRFASEITPDIFTKEISKARTFGFKKDVEPLRKAGFALGSSLENSVVIGENQEGILNPDGLRYKDEFVRHKLLDAIGDLALSGVPILGAYRSYRGGHKLNFMTLKALLEDKTAWTLVESNELGAFSASEDDDFSTAKVARVPAAT